MVGVARGCGDWLASIHDFRGARLKALQHSAILAEYLRLSTCTLRPQGYVQHSYNSEIPDRIKISEIVRDKGIRE
jgi:hypothetical protein